MSKNKLFDDDSEEEEVKFKTENEYAKKYDNWREKEELHKLEQKYGSKALSSDASISSDSEDDDDEPPEVSEEVETKFLKTLALLKTKDPRIYDPHYKFFEEKVEKIEEAKPQVKTLTFEDSDDDDSDDGNIFKVEKKAEIKTDSSDKGASSSLKRGEEGKLKDFLTGKAEHIDDEVEKDLQPLRALWSDPTLNESEAFLRDYILNKRYLDDGDVGEVDKLRDDEDLEEDERRVEQQGQFERAYNFRFEEPDEEYLKRYPRTMNYVRPKDDKRSKKRAEVRARKEEEKKRKMDEIARMKALKLKEIQQKIDKIKEVTGNKELAFKEEDIEGDFDPEEHDRRMKALFDEQFYGDVDDRKPEFPDLDEELEIENWEKYEQEHQNDDQNNQNDELHCEDDEFNMDADYDPKQARANLIEEIQSTLVKKRRNRKKKSKLAQLLSKEKPKFIPNEVDKTYDQYMEEYFKMDCEDVIGGDLPTRFKYREVVPNDFGLTVEEILLADDRELTQWVPLKRLVKHRPADVEKGEVNIYRQKAADVSLKRKILPSLFKDLPENPEIVVPVEETRKKKKKQKDTEEQPIEETADNEPTPIDNNGEITEADRKESKKTKKSREVSESNVEVVENIEIEASPKKKKKKRKDSVSNDTEIAESAKTSERKKEKKIEKLNSERAEVQEINIKGNAEVKSKKKKKQKTGEFTVEKAQNVEPSHSGHEGIKINKNKINLQEKSYLKRKLGIQKHKKINVKNKNKFKQNDKFKHKGPESSNPLSKISDERLKAYGLNPKKYKNFLLYKKF